MRIISLMALAGGMVFLASLASAQTGHTTPRDAFRVIGDAELAKLSSGKAPLVLSTLVDHENHYVLVAGRSGPGEVEIHEHWIDYMVIQQGEAEFTSGGIASGMHDTGPGEKRGGAITRGTVVSLKPGDFVVVPAGQPHLTMIKGSGPFRAVIVKVRE
jgi:beta-galactosidase beta subunit